MMLARELNNEGLRQFCAYIERRREGGSPEMPRWILADPHTSTSLQFDLELEPLKFASRFEMGVYLSGVLADKNVQPLIGRREFWSWLALFWFDLLCPAGVRPSKPYNYILSADYRHRPRHAIAATWQLVSRYGESARFLLCNEMTTRGELMEQLMARQDFLTIDGVIRLASSLYSDPRNGRFKKGATSRKTPGSVHRFITWLQQLELTYDLYSISEMGLAALLPAEFDRFREA